MIPGFNINISSIIIYRVVKKKGDNFNASFKRDKQRSMNLVTKYFKIMYVDLNVWQKMDILKKYKKMHRNYIAYI